MTVEPDAPMVRAGVAITMEVSTKATIAIQLAMAGDPPPDELLRVHLDADPVDVTEVQAPEGGRMHLLRAGTGTLEITYSATRPATTARHLEVSSEERIQGLRPSRYCPSDRVLGLAHAEFGAERDAAATMRAVCQHVSDHTSYTVGSSGASTDAVETLLSGQGVCRDYAHAVAMLGRAVGIPTRLAAVYAPGLSPMDMHAVVEADIDGLWRVFDATRLAPRHSLVRIATGRDAADTAFLTTLEGRTNLTDLQVTAVSDGDLPVDDHVELVSLPAR